MMSMCGLLRCLFLHSLHLMMFAGKLEGCTHGKKPRIDFMGLVTGI